MLSKVLVTAALTIGVSVSAHAAKFFEWNDPVQGNYPPECTAYKSYGTGGGGYGYTFTYDEYTVQCPGHQTTKVSRHQVWQSGSYSCDLWDDNANYTMSWNNCNNWRLYD